tara:strand:+ start:1124 stop:1390 length:267 start_codon:yes stop_codon:yes gene_type:complete
MDSKFDELQILEDVEDYIVDTYKQHYAGKYQATDMIIDAGHGEGFCIGNIMKYAMRCGKKDEKEKELLKIIHYAIIAIYIQRKENDRR